MLIAASTSGRALRGKTHSFFTVLVLVTHISSRRWIFPHIHILDQVRVYYNPADCSEAVLERGSADGISFLYVVGGTFAAVGVFFLIMSLTGHVHMGS
jgi:hypothetical protein